MMKSLDRSDDPNYYVYAQYNLRNVIDSVRD